MTTLPDWYPWPETETKPAPMPLLLVQAFVNTLDLDLGEDLLGADWFVTAGLLDTTASAAAGAGELQLARTMRESIRQLLELDAGDLAPLREVADERAAKLLVGEGGALTLAPSTTGQITDALFQLLLIIRAAQEGGTWSRLRVCASDTCRWAFYDRSKNRQGHWCDMAVCGNRLKNRELRARRRDGARRAGASHVERS
ncbi:MAG TPA: CGNR zinc finger domain-containing protein [Solirubrobacteraceae bacterium]|nr:CGNR zinc finger domain-containing protein [Solirubrobacteraceae bacterium]